jgi:hypothetical protein
MRHLSVGIHGECGTVRDPGKTISFISDELNHADHRWLPIVASENPGVSAQGCRAR